ncbi:MAG: purine-binding chemotaxis protein CheW [Nitrospirae bacterium]|nr:purine-binding chemotaxis protein CheW [Nitrospirota bacterium]
MIFRILDKLFGVKLAETVEIISPAKIREVPLSYFYVKGIMDYRGDFLPVLSLRRRFSLDDPIDGERFILVVKAEERFGLTIDEVMGIVTVSDDKIEPSPPKVMGIGSKYISGVIKYDERQTVILDMRVLFSTQSRIQLVL